MSDLIGRQAAIDAIEEYADRLQMADWKENPAIPYKAHTLNWCINTIRDLPSAQPEPFVDADKLKRCRFEYINACKIVARPTPDTSKNDIYDAYAVIKALHPIFGDAGF